jgi:hypothetical protein
MFHRLRGVGNIIARQPIPLLPFSSGIASSLGLLAMARGAGNGPNDVVRPFKVALRGLGEAEASHYMPYNEEAGVAKILDEYRRNRL